MEGIINKTKKIHLYKDEIDSELWESITRKLNCVDNCNNENIKKIGIEIIVLDHYHFKAEVRFENGVTEDKQ